MQQWTSDTKAIIDKHTGDFRSTNYDKVVPDYNAYVKFLGGIFAKEQAPVKTVTEFQERCEYVQGLMAVWKFCYWNGKTWWFWKNSASASFYSKKQTSQCPTGTIEQLCDGVGNRTRITNCNYGVDTLSKAMGKSIWSVDYAKMIANGAKKITDKSKLKPGDLIHFFSGSIKKSNWKHVAIVYSTAGGEIVLADFGQRFIKTGNPHHLFPSEYSNYGSNWFGIHWIDLTDDEEKTMYSTSKLVNYTKISPNSYGQRNHTIDRITPHCVVGQCSVEVLGDIFSKPEKQASSNYGIGADGRVGLYVPESNGSWCSSDMTNDMRAITIECASDSTAPYAFNVAVYDKLIKLCVDICKRYGKKKLLWFGDKAKTLAYTPKADEMVLTVHRWFAQKSCPGDWMYQRMGDLATKVTNELNPKEVIPIPRTIKIGSTGKLVKMWQTYLGGLKVDGKFGAKTKAATIAWQKKKGLTQDGVVGPKSWTAALKSLQ